MRTIDSLDDFILILTFFKLFEQNTPEATKKELTFQIYGSLKSLLSPFGAPLSKALISQEDVKFSDKEEKIKWLRCNQIPEKVWETLCKWSRTLTLEEYIKQYGEPELSFEEFQQMGGTQQEYQRLLFYNFVSKKDITQSIPNQATKIRIMANETGISVRLLNSLSNWAKNNMFDETFGASIKIQPPPSTALDTELPFQNREKEIERIARISLENLNVSRLQPSERSQHKMCLITTAQMWGSGKSWLGTHFLPQFRSIAFQKLREELEKKYGDSVSTLSNSKYILIDFRDYSYLFHRNISIFNFLSEALLSKMISLFPEDGPFWENQRINSWAPAKIANWFSEKYKQNFFIHFDEIDAIMELGDKKVEEGIPAAKRYYEFWNFVNAFLLSGHFLYCSGRSAYIYALGRGLFRDGSLFSPGRNECLMLDTLKKNHIENILKSEPGIVNDSSREYIASMLYSRTSGIPRFIGYGVKWLKQMGIGSNTPQEEIPPTLFGDEFRKYIATHAYSELNPMSGFPLHKKKIYARLVALAALKIPINPDILTKPSIWGLHESSDKENRIPFLEMIRIFNLYIEKSDTDGEWRIIFPDIVLDQIALDEMDDDIPYWIAFSKLRYSRPWDKGKLFEELSRHCIELILIKTIEYQNTKSTFEEKFPFLKGSLLGKAMAVLSKTPFKCFPMMKEKGIKSLSNLDPAEQETKISKLQSLLQKPVCFHFLDMKQVQSGRADWSYLIKELIQSRIFYIPIDKSSSADLMYYTDQRDSLHFQFKAHKIGLSSKILVDEAKKVAEACIQPFKITFVVVALNINENNMQKNSSPKPKIIVNHEQEPLSFYFSPGSLIENWKIPENMDIVVLLSAGVEGILTRHNLAFLKSDETITFENSLEILNQTSKLGKQKYF